MEKMLFDILVRTNAFTYYSIRCSFPAYLRILRSQGALVLSAISLVSCTYIIKTYPMYPAEKHILKYYVKRILLSFLMWWYQSLKRTTYLLRSIYHSHPSVDRVET